MKCGTKSVIPYEMRGTARSKWSIAGGHVRRHDRRIVDGGFRVAGIHTVDDPKQVQTGNQEATDAMLQLNFGARRSS
jgi:hypothetical protein